LERGVFGRAEVVIGGLVMRVRGEGEGGGKG